jgi:hypothetical protein
MCTSARPGDDILMNDKQTIRSEPSEPCDVAVFAGARGSSVATRVYKTDQDMESHITGIEIPVCFTICLCSEGTWRVS